ncbi:PilZ domain-containing protein [Sphingomonas crusticola]|uniref:PilZ domain-containing protein n=1 Tax=Sphingomonas crusticola TaxID=1697973 RepID=UPI000E227E6D|nr:PilZ domain-containing protein [Sphingomonas crusticola]
MTVERPFKHLKVAVADQRVGSSRADARESVLLMAMLRGPRAPHVPVRVRNLSAGGMMVVSQVLVCPDDAVKVELAGVGTIEGKVAWVFSGRIGIQFDKPIDPLLAETTVRSR